MNGTDETGLLAGEVVASVGAVLTVVGSVLPWVSAQPTATLGGAPSGPVAALVGMGVVLVALFRAWTTIDKVVVGVLGVVVLVVVANAMLTLGAAAGSPGVGLYVVLLGGVIVVIGAGIGLVGGARGPTATPRRS